MCEKRHEGVEFDARDGTESCTVEGVHSWDPSNPCSQGKTDAKTMMMNIKSIDTISFSNDIFSSSLYTAPLSSLNAYILQFSSTLSLLDKHAPLKTITCPSQQRKPFITDDIVKEKAKRCKLETIYRRNKTPANKANFKNQARFFSNLII